MYKLTIEGHRYLKSGLPEKRLIEAVASGKDTIEKIKSLEDSGIGINWSKKNDWVEISSGRIQLTKRGKAALGMKTSVEEGLELAETGKLNEEVLGILLSRNLIEEVKHTKVLGIKEIGQLTPEIIVSGAWKNVPFKKYDVNTPVPETILGKKQLYKSFLDEVKDELVSLGFKEMVGPLVESCFFNCDALFMPQDHPARDTHDIYFIKGKETADLRRYSNAVTNVKKMHESGGSGSRGWRVSFSENESKRLLLRTQGTALSARTLLNKNLNIPGKYFGVARCYRPDVIDATHLSEFNQLEGIVVGDELNFRHLLGLMEEFAKNIAGVKRVKFLPGYFPFTEPSVEGYIHHPKLNKWIEVLPAGIFRPEVTSPFGIEETVLAWGIGIDRLFMVKHNIHDIRQLFSSDLKWLREATL